MGVGSPAYMSPEQIKAYPLNQKTDLYSLGVVLFQLLTGRLPFRANNPATLIYRIISLDTPSICTQPESAVRTRSDPEEGSEKDLYNRYRNGAEFAKDLASVRYQILEDHDTQQDTAHYQMLRDLPFFTDFDEVEVWGVAAHLRLAGSGSQGHPDEGGRRKPHVRHHRQRLCRGVFRRAAICRLGPGRSSAKWPTCIRRAPVAGQAW